MPRDMCGWLPESGSLLLPPRYFVGLAADTKPAPPSTAPLVLEPELPSHRLAVEEPVTSLSRADSRAPFSYTRNSP